MTELSFHKKFTELTSLLDLCINARMGIGMQSVTAVPKPLFQGSRTKFVKESSKIHNVL